MADQTKDENQKRGPWSANEDQLLLTFVSERGPNNWVKISSQLVCRSAKQCRERYHQNLKPSLDHSPITAEEGRTINRLVEQLGRRWAEIARHLVGRSDNTVKNWWNGNQNRQRRLRERQRRDSTLSDKTTGSAPAEYLQPQQPQPQQLGPLVIRSPRVQSSAMHYRNQPLPSPSYSEHSDFDRSRYSNSPHHVALARRVSVELAPLLRNFSGDFGHGHAHNYQLGHGGPSQHQSQHHPQQNHQHQFQYQHEYQYQHQHQHQHHQHYNPYQHGYQNQHQNECNQSQHQRQRQRQQLPDSRGPATCHSPPQALPTAPNSPELFFSSFSFEAKKNKDPRMNVSSLLR